MVEEEVGFFPSAVLSLEEPRILKDVSCPDVVAMTARLETGTGAGNEIRIGS